MSKKDFIALADSIKAANRTDQVDHFTDSQIEWLADFCKEQNSQFKRERWLGYVAGAGW